MRCGHPCNLKIGLIVFVYIGTFNIYLVLTTDSWNTLVRLCAKRASKEPDSAQSIRNRIRDRRISVFGHVRRLQGSVPAHEALRLVVNSHAGHRPDDRPAWKRPRDRLRQTWIRQLEIDVGLAEDAAWDMAGDRDVWRAQQPIAGQAVQ